MRIGVLAIAILLLTPLAHAGEADQAALVAYQAHDANCAAVAAGETSAADAEQQAVVTSAWRDVITAYDNTGQAFLLYWRGVLSQCLDQEDRAAKDLQLFIELEQFDERFAALVKDARKRLRRMQVEVREPGQAEIDAAKAAKAAGGEYSIARDAQVLKPAKVKQTLPFFAIGAGGGYQRFGDFNYVASELHVSIQLKGPLRLTVAGRPAWAVSWATEELDDTGAVVPTSINTRGSILLDIAGGAELMFGAGPLRVRVAALFHGAPNSNHDGMIAQDERRQSDAGDAVVSATAIGPVLIGGALQVGVDVPLGTEVAALRVAGEVGNLGPALSARLTAGFVIGLPGPRARTR